MVAVTGMGVGRSDEWYTPPYIFEALGEHFDLDVASPPRRTNVPCDQYFTAYSLELDWHGFIWMNPPFGGPNGIIPWMNKFFAHGNGLALTPDRTSAPWFRSSWDQMDLTLFTPKISFERPDGSNNGNPANGTTLWAAGDRAVRSLRRAAASGLGILAARVDA